MDTLIDTIEGRLQFALGQKDFEAEVLKQRLSEAQKENEDLREKLRQVEQIE